MCGLNYVLPGLVTDLFDVKHRRHIPMFEYLAPSELQHLFIHNNNLNYRNPARARYFVS